MQKSLRSLSLSLICLLTIPVGCGGGESKEKPLGRTPVTNKAQGAEQSRRRTQGKSPQKPSNNQSRDNPVSRTPLPRGERTVAMVTETLTPGIRKRLKPTFQRTGVAWPPPSITLLAFKREKRLEVWSTDPSGANKLLRSYRILAASGNAGVKRREGDRQVPEGFYNITELNPNSQFHLSMRVSYPNAEDIRNSTLPRQQMGGDIYIHGNKLSIGCLAMGDSAIEEIFVLTAAAPPANRKIVIAPYDFRAIPALPQRGVEAWVLDIYRRIQTTLKRYR